MKKILFIANAFVLLLMQQNAHGQIVDTLAELKKLSAEMTSMKDIGYQYSNSVQFPNGDKDLVNGKMVIDNDRKLYFNDCNAYTVIYTEHWFYKADHRKKTIMIVNLDKNYDKKLKKKTEKDIFSNGVIEKYADAGLLKKAIVKSMKNNIDGSITIVLSFPTSSPVKQLELSYDRKNQIPIAYSIDLLEFIGQGRNNKDGINVKMKCTNFTRTTNKSDFNVADYFSYTKGKLELKKYNHYKVSANNINI